MSLGDRIGRSLFVALAVGLGWGIRGDFGHVIGAMYPGAALALAFAYVSGQRSVFLWMPILAGLAAPAIGVGGTMSYGILHGYAQADTFLNYAYGFLTLFLQGAAWGTFGGALIGLILERRPMRTADWLGLLGSVYVAGWLVSFLVVDVAGFQINPPRNNGSVALMGGALGQLAWLAANRRWVGLRGAVLGYVGFGLGMAGGRLLGNVANVLSRSLDFAINHWNVMEVSCGLIGGFVFAFGMVDRSYPEPPEGENFGLASFFGMLTTLGFLPLWHRLARINPEPKLAEWSKALASYGYDDPDGLARNILLGLDGACAVGFLGVAVWAVIHYGKRQRLAAVPVLWLSATMLIFQNLNALYFFYPREPGRVNMHTVFWVLFAAMLGYVAFARPRPAVFGEAEVERPFAWGRWAAVAVVGLAAIIGVSAFVNGERTMTSANTRWPVWSWSQGPFPGRPPAP